ncbi:MAG: carboxypeptidase M32 [Actinobacteria bacterium]|nr:carboxypeptidase M32 [Actinomycetota bacterium]
MKEKFEELKRRLGEVADLSCASQLLDWDHQVLMPAGAAGLRAEESATLDRLTHERFTSDEIGRLLEDLRPYEESLDQDSDEASLIRVTRRDWEKARKVPSDLLGEMSHAAATALPVWVEARKNSDFASFLPCLERNVELKRRYIECFEGEPYDILLDDYEEGMKAPEVREVFDELKRELVPLIEKAKANPVDDSFLETKFPVEQQRALNTVILDRFGWDPNYWRLDEIVHPAAYSFGTMDIRITTRYAEDGLESLYSTMHEFGHGLYERQVDPALERSPLCSGASLGLHESQSRMWENLVGRGLPFLRWFYPQLQEAFPQQLGSVDVESFYRAVNKIQPSLIRVDADQVTYNMHVILRFELEQAIIDGSIALEDLPEAWNAKMKEYLGIDVPDDRRGVLQDVHWSGGGLGYFPTYSLGNVISLQIWGKVREAIPDLDDQFERGEFGALREWLGENLHRYGRKFTPMETIERVAGSSLDAGPYLHYLKDKVGELTGAAA